MMNREQAIKIIESLYLVSGALHNVRRATAGLDLAERQRVDAVLDELSQVLIRELINPFHDRNPEIEPDDIDDAVRPNVGIPLDWKDVVLPSAVSEAELDSMIFSLLTPRWQKTLMLIDGVRENCRDLALEMIAARLQVLADNDRIEACGDLTVWNRSMVRLTDEDAEPAMHESA